MGLVNVPVVRAKAREARETGVEEGRGEKEKGDAEKEVVKVAEDRVEARLKHAQARADGRRVREDEDLPAVCRRVRLDNVLEPLELLVVDGHLVARVLCGAEDGRAWRLKASGVGDVGGGALEHPSQ